MTTAKAKAEELNNSELDQAKEAAAQAYENFLEAQKHLKLAAREAGVDLKDTAHEKFEESVEKIQAKRKEVLGDSEDYIRANPLTSAGIAFVSGFVISKLFSK